MSERVFSSQPVTQYNLITGEVRKKVEKSAVDDRLKISKVSDEFNISGVVALVIDNVPVATETDKETESGVAAVEKHNPKVTNALKNKLTGKGKKPVVGKDKDKPKNIALDVVKESLSLIQSRRVEKEVSDEECLPKKGNKKLTKKVKNKESDENSIPKKGDKIEVTPSKIHDMLGVPFRGYSLFDLEKRETEVLKHSFTRPVKIGEELKKVCVNDIARKLIATQEIDFLFKVNFLTLFTNTMGKADGLNGQICLDVVRRLREDSVIFDIDRCGNWSSYLMKQRKEMELKDHVVGLLDLHDEWNEAEVQESQDDGNGDNVSDGDENGEDDENRDDDGGNVNNDVNDCDVNGDSEDYVNLFKDPISFEDDGNGDNVSDDDENGEDDENRDDDGGNVNNDVNDCDVNGDSEDDFGNDSGLAEKDKAVEGNTTEQGTVVEGNEAEEGEIMSTPENFT
nr:hypothetical protein [Tanacetum cinerariifolium]